MKVTNQSRLPMRAAGTLLCLIALVFSMAFTSGSAFAANTVGTTVTPGAQTTTSTPATTTVKKVPATDITLSQTSLVIADNGAMWQLYATVQPSDCTDKVTWRSSDTRVVKVDSNGIVTSVNQGTATVTATAGNYTAVCTFTIVKGVTGINLNKRSLSLQSGETKPLIGEAVPYDAYNRDVVWMSSNPNVASVDYQGNVTGIRKGTAVITCASTDDSGATAKCNVTVTNSVYYCSSPDQMESKHVYDFNCSDVWVYTIPGARGVALTFDARTYTEPCYDFIEIWDNQERMLGSFSGTELAGATAYVEGDTIMICLRTDDTDNEWGFDVSSAWAYNPDGWVNTYYGKMYYIDGAPLAGEVLLDGNWYYFDPETGYMATGLTELPGGITKLYGDDGIRIVGSVKMDDGWRWFNEENGEMYIGLHHLLDGTWTYYDEDGISQNGTFTFLGQKYHFGAYDRMDSPKTTTLPDGFMAEEHGGPTLASLGISTK
ncbi:MAG: Ig-like domain-containing protein [Coriobacteriales bacterium]|nr:Ig-like domain-containing protein [Coriobacteriales bacterium]